MKSAMSIDTSDVTAGLTHLGGGLLNSLARSMAVAGGQVLRDEAKVRAPKGTAEGGSITPGLLASAMYLAYQDTKSTETVVMYSVSWNAKKAPHGHLQEFGHWQTHAAYIGTDGEWYTNLDAPLAQPRWVPAQPFLRPALDTAGARALQAMVDRGRVRLPELLAEAP